MTTTPTISHRPDCARPDVRKISSGPGYLGVSYHKCLGCETTDLPSTTKRYDERALDEQLRYERTGRAAGGGYFGNTDAF